MLSIFQKLFFIIALFPLALVAQFAGGSGTFEDPWLIRTPENLDSIRYCPPDNFFKQTSDIDLGVAPWNVGTGWEPVGNDSMFFQGYYEGNGFKIINLTINRPEYDYIGLFGYLSWSTIKNVELINVNILGKNKVGCLAGFCTASDYETCSTKGVVTGIFEVGGLIGTADYSVILNCYSDADVSGTRYIGGMIGKCVNLSKSYVSINKSYSIGSVSGAENTGGLVGYDDIPNSRFCYWDTEKSGQTVSAGGEGRTTEEMTYDYLSDTYEYWDFENIWTEDFENKNNGYPFLMNSLSPLVPDATSNLTSSCENGDFSVELSWNNPDSLLNDDPVTELTAVHIYRNFDLIYTINSPLPGNSESYSDIVALTGNYTYKVIGVNSEGYGINARINQSAGNLFAGGNGTEAEPYLVSNAEQLNNIRYYTGKDGVCFKQTETIDLGVAPWNEGKGWIPIGNDEPYSEFQGNYDATEEIYPIVNLTINDSTKNYASLFGVTINADLRNMQFQNVNINGYLACGALAGSSFYSNITNCSSYGNISGLQECGGILGSSWGDSISTSYSNADVTGQLNTGGLIGYLMESTQLINCYAAGAVTGFDRTGGLVGTNNDASIKNCYSIGFVSGSSNTGGLAGISPTAISSYWNTELSGQATSACGEGKTTWEMWNYDTYVDWDFVNIWKEHYQSGHPDYPIFFWQSVGIEDNSSSIPKDFVLSQNYPNPFNPTTNISYSVPQGFSGVVKLSVYNANGQLIKELVNEKKSSGMYSVEFNAAVLNSGLYIYRLKTENSDISKKMIILK